MEDLGMQIENLGMQIEDDDLVYLDCYLDSIYSDSPSFKDVTSTWSPLSEELGCSTESYIGITPSLLELQSSPSNDINASEPDDKPARKKKGIQPERFVTYEAFPLVRKKPITCEFCGLKLSSKESCKRHILSKHIKERPHVCGTCGKTFVFRFSLKAHSAIHDATPKHDCVCGASFKLRTSFMSHIRRIHQAAPETKFSCELCFKPSKNRHALRRHMMSVHEPKTIPCIEKGCKKVFSSVGLMRCHYRYHLNQKFACDKCDLSFSTESYMQKHLLTHSGIRSYTCVDCAKTYLSASHLNQHRRICHSTDKLHQCSFCGKRFKTKELLQYHENNHRGEKPYKCNVCGYATAYRNTYYVHRKKHLTIDATSSASQKQTVTKNGGSGTSTKKNKNSSVKSRHKKVQCAIKPKLPSVNDPPGLLKVLRQDPPQSICDGSVDIFSSSPSYSVSPLSFPSLSSPSTSCAGKQVNVDFIIFPTSVINCSPQEVCEPILGNNLDLSLKGEEPVLNVIADDISFDNQCVRDQSDVTLSLCVNNETASETEKSDCAIILSNNGRCSVSECESTDDSLLLIKIGENSYAGVCTNHSVSNEMDVSELNWNSVENLTLTTVNSKSLGADISDSSNSLGLSSSFDSMNMLQSEAATLPSQCLFDVPSPDKSGGSPLILASPDQAIMVANNCDQPDVTDALLLPLSHTEGLKSVSCEDQTETLIPSADIDAGMQSLSNHIDDSFHLAQLDVVCQLCDEQFLCMDTFITHMETVHK